MQHFPGLPKSSCMCPNRCRQNASADPAPPDAPEDLEVDALAHRKAWARLPAKVHALDVLACPRCGRRMSVIACLGHRGRGPPPPD